MRSFASSLGVWPKSRQQPQPSFPRRREYSGFGEKRQRPVARPSRDTGSRAVPLCRGRKAKSKSPLPSPPLRLRRKGKGRSTWLCGSAREASLTRERSAWLLSSTGEAPDHALTLRDKRCDSARPGAPSLARSAGELEIAASDEGEGSGLSRSTLSHQAPSLPPRTWEPAASSDEIFRESERLQAPVPQLPTGIGLRLTGMSGGGRAVAGWSLRLGS